MNVKICHEVAKYYDSEHRNSVRLVYDDVMEFNKAADRWHPATEIGDMVEIDHINRAITFMVARMSR